MKRTVSCRLRLGLILQTLHDSPHLVGHGIPDPLIELLALHHEVAVPRLDDAALGGDGPGGVDVVPGHHAHLQYQALIGQLVITTRLLIGSP